MANRDLAFGDRRVVGGEVAVMNVYLTCPACGRTWLEAMIDPLAWWGRGVTPESIAARCWCRCGARPPMRVGGDPAQERLFT